MILRVERMLVQLAAFNDVMRLNPKGTGLRVDLHSLVLGFEMTGSRVLEREKSSLRFDTLRSPRRRAWTVVVTFDNDAEARLFEFLHWIFVVLQ